MARVKDAFLLCAGLGTRLAPLTADHPKPMLPLFDAPLAWWAGQPVVDQGVERLYFNTYQHADAFRGLARWWDDAAVVVEESREQVELGTGGGLRSFLDRAGGEGPYWIANGDLLFGGDLGALAEAHRTSGAVATLGLLADGVEATVGWRPADGGVVALPGRGGRAEAPATSCEGTLAWVGYSGYAIVERELIAAIDGPAPSCWIRAGLARCLERGAPVQGVLLHGPWADLGTPARMWRGVSQALAGAEGWASGPQRQRLMEGRVGAPGAWSWLSPQVPADARDQLGAWAHVGAESRLEAGAWVEEALLLGGGATLRGSLRRSVRYGAREVAW